MVVLFMTMTHKLTNEAEQSRIRRFRSNVSSMRTDQVHAHDFSVGTRRHISIATKGMNIAPVQLFMVHRASILHNFHQIDKATDKSRKTVIRRLQTSQAHRPTRVHT